MIQAVKTFIQSIREKGDLKSLVFHTSWGITMTSGLSYLFGFLRDRLFAQTFGLSRTLDIYNAAFVVPDTILQVVVMAALSAPFIPIFAKLYDEKREAGFKYANQFIFWSILALGVATLTTGLFLPYFAHLLVPGFNQEEVKEYIFLSRVLMASPFLFALSSVYGKMLMSVREFFWWGLAPAVYNLGIIAGTLLFSARYGSLGIVIGTLIGILFHIGVRYAIIRKPRYGFRHKLETSFSPEMKETVILTLPKVVQYGLVSILLLQFTSVATELGEGAVAAYNYARNFQSIPVALLGIAIAVAAYPSLCHDAGKKNFKKYRQDFRRDFIRLVFYTGAAALALILISKPLVGLLLRGGKFDEKDVELVATTLQVFCLSIPLESLMHLYHRAFYSLKNTMIPAVSHSLVMVLTIGLAKYWSPEFGIQAIPLSFAAGLALQILVLWIFFPSILRKAEAA